MSKNSPIALIDSGIGGLSLLKALSKKYPCESYIYLADNANMPYGNKSVKFLKNRLLHLINYLYENFNIKLVILACNTASISSLEYLNKHSPVEVLGLNISKFLGEGDYKIICTKLSTKCYKGFNAYACNNLAKIIEENIFNQKVLHKKIKTVLQKANICEKNIVLGCSHYELVLSHFKALAPDKNFILPCNEFVKNLKLDNSSSKRGDILMLSTLPTKSYIDKLWKIYKA